MKPIARRIPLLAALVACVAVPSSCGSDDTAGAVSPAGGFSGTASNGGAAGKAGAAGKSGKAGAPSAGGAGASGASTGGAGGKGGSAGECAPGVVPADLPGWEEYTDYSCDCRFYIPGEKGESPEPVTWEPCKWKYTEGLACQRMRVPWTADGAYGHTVGTAMSWWADRQSGEVWMAFSRTRWASSPNRKMVVVARVDDAGGGKVASALSKDVGFCYANPTGVQSGRYALEVTGGIKTSSAEDSRYRGLIAGSVGERPSFVKRFFAEDPGALVPSWAFSRSYIYELFFETRGHPFDDYEHPVSVFSSAKGYTYAGAATVGDGLLFAGRNQADQEGGIYWSEPTGLAPLVLYPDGTLSAERVGSDGEDIVWTEVDYASGDEWKYPRHTMTAKWSTDLGVNMATKRNLGVDLPYSNISLLRAWTVGCGYAAKAFVGQFSPGEPSVGMLRVVRLSDGATWSIAGETPDKPGASVLAKRNPPLLAKRVPAPRAWRAPNSPRFPRRGKLLDAPGRVKGGVAGANRAHP